ncbi:MAG TPA: hypothetical protein DCF63_10380 [Planctomycetaceae bacterium]|nr:hypothetical protein [Planctomycetaceae bacterium]
MPTDAAPEITQEMLQQNPVLLYYLLFVGMVIMAMGVGSLASWAWIFYSRANGKSLLPMRRPWTPGHWSLLDMAMIAASVIVLQVVLAQMAMQFLDITRDGEISLEAAAAGGLASVFGVGLSALWIMARYRQGPGHVGFDLLSPKRLGQGVVLGLAALPVVYILMMVVSLVSKTDYEHPLITSATQSGTLSSYLMGFFAAAIAAPIVEEFLFRVILQGWLQALPFKSFSTNLVGWPVRLKGDPTSILDNAQKESLALPESAPLPTTDTNGTSSTISVAEPIIMAELVPVAEVQASSHERALEGFEVFRQPDSNPYRSTVTESSIAVDSPTNWQLTPPWWPAVMTGILFGMAHISYGMSFIPLSFLGILLGFVYRQTHSIWPCILIHMMLNTLSMLMLGVLILVQQSSP